MSRSANIFAGLSCIVTDLKRHKHNAQMLTTSSRTTVLTWHTYRKHQQQLVYLMFHFFNKSSLIASVTQMLWDDNLPKILSYLSNHNTPVKESDTQSAFPSHRSATHKCIENPFHCLQSAGSLSEPHIKFSQYAFSLARPSAQNSLQNETLWTSENYWHIISLALMLSDLFPNFISNGYWIHPFKFTFTAHSSTVSFRRGIVW